MSKCPTPGCDAPIDPNDALRRFCERCGWPLAEADVGLEPAALEIRGRARLRTGLRVVNTRNGELRWELLEMPPGVTAVRAASPVGPYQQEMLELEVDPTRLPDTDTHRINLRTWDRHGLSGLDLRLQSETECYQDRTVFLKVRSVTLGPLTSPTRTLLFGGSVRVLPVTVRNEGQGAMKVRAEASAGFRLQEMGAAGSTLELVVEGGHFRTLSVQWMGRGRCDGTLTFHPEEGDPLKVGLVALDLPEPAPPKERYAVAIDFGTTKSAVMVLDQAREGAEPQPLLWPRPGHPEPERWVPSRVAWTGDRPTHFGWEMADTETGDHIFTRLKMRLTEDDERTRRSIVFFLRRIFDRIVAQDEFGVDILSQSQLILSLPVLDGAEAARAQRDLTLKFVLEAGEPYGITSPQCSFADEPECAALDFLHLLYADRTQLPPGEATRPQATLQPGDWICVMDLGGGTTDLTFGRVAQTEHGIPTLAEVHSLGFADQAGDRVTEEFYCICLEHWVRQKALVAPTPDVPARSLVKSPVIRLVDEKNPWLRDAILARLNERKQQMFRDAEPRTQTEDNTVRRDFYVEFTPSLVSRYLREHLIDGMFAPLRQHLEDWSLVPSQIKLLCLTGGTSRVPDFEAVFRERLALLPERVPTLTTPESVRLNVVRGAARRPSQRLPSLETSILLRTSTRQEEWALKRGALPGASTRVVVRVPVVTGVTLELLATYPDEPEFPLWQSSVEHESHQSRSVELRIEYLANGALRVSGQWLHDDALPAIPAQIVQQLPQWAL